ncbi:MAG TPA: prepilin-type N-terminal cleavage/methylation domain-containing protein [Candidatus Angelobacter sp.]|nr:prepilin-type N-terminal cleavage/methylation domain-containing protein [Candidatus Angelobacter sp.]
MKKNAGFTLIELMVAIGVSSVALAAAVLMFRDSTKANSNVTQNSDMSDNMRAGLNLIVQDLIQTGTGIPTGGISIPNTANAAGCNTGGKVNRPPAVLTLTFNGPNAASAGCNVILPAIEPGPDLGPTVTSPDGTSGPQTDILTLMYVDNTMDSKPLPIISPTCAGSITATGSSITFDNSVGCGVTIGGAGIPVNPGDLFMIYNANNSNGVLQTVTAVAGQVLSFASGDAFNLNGRTATETAGTILSLQNGAPTAPNGTYPSPTSCVRVWMITYYLDATADPKHPRLMRAVNFNAPQPVAETFENLQFTFNLVDGTTPAPVNQGTIPTGDNENQIRSVNVYLGARSTTTAAMSGQYTRSNLATQVALRSMAYFNTYK